MLTLELIQVWDTRVLFHLLHSNNIFLYIKHLYFILAQGPGVSHRKKNLNILLALVTPRLPMSVHKKI